MITESYEVSDDNTDSPASHPNLAKSGHVTKRVATVSASPALIRVLPAEPVNSIPGTGSTSKVMFGTPGRTSDVRAGLSSKEPSLQKRKTIFQMSFFTLMPSVVLLSVVILRVVVPKIVKEFGQVFEILNVFNLKLFTIF